VLRVAHAERITDRDQAQAIQVAIPLLARLNTHEGTPGQGLEATRRITKAGDAELYIRRRALRVTRRTEHTICLDDDVGVLRLTGTERLALEIAMNGDAERQAMQGELSALEDAWRNAEEIAEIADRMFLP
jgi:hypothetical protein